MRASNSHSLTRQRINIREILYDDNYDVDNNDKLNLYDDDVDELISCDDFILYDVDDDDDDDLILYDADDLMLCDNDERQLKCHFSIAHSI